LITSVGTYERPMLERHSTTENRPAAESHAQAMLPVLSDERIYPSVYGRLWWHKPSQTITTGFLTPGRGRYIHPLRPRVIMPHEAARIQSFPDTFSFVVDPSTPPSRTGLQKWIGDAVPPLLGYAATLPLMVRM
jgi:DNA (cytosine-5)-methyltransferase 1